jgi:hypothetical protein
VSGDVLGDRTGEQEDHGVGLIGIFQRPSSCPNQANEGPFHSWSLIHPAASPAASTASSTWVTAS